MTLHGSVEPRRSSIIGEVDSEPRSSPPREALSGWRFCCGETPSGLDRVCAVVLHSGLGRWAALGRTELGLLPKCLMATKSLNATPLKFKCQQQFQRE